MRDRSSYASFQGRLKKLAISGLQLFGIEKAIRGHREIALERAPPDLFMLTAVLPTVAKRTFSAGR